ncbi:ABC transporter ATP-binding protein [Siccirubricoccus deserti]|uniref:ABC transporter ATP-binding protein n=1 Tax=Siccirubricoccus deserti TaxID=2013562 RepID=A0A9X0QZ83_9PROT|nr:ABC transporter ATP-binding protein [Siccirubricoccus deserti]MBC4016696.1 ABC transporter ATP-binding protein [Siccirubricoccus deserti]GGC51182.1 ABC transporter ATP-binding protein [Siccirubricoccus deserti]
MSIMGEGRPVLSVENLAVHIRTDAGVARILDDVTFAVPRGGALGVVGESGCGKSTLLRAILGILPRGATVPKGAVLFEDRDILTDRAASARGRIGFIPQDPYLSLNPVFRAGDQFLEIMRRHAPGSRRDHRDTLVELFRAVQLPDPGGALAKYPHQFSGGQRQRLLIAAALACEPALVVADEPTTALDVTTQREILGLLRQLTTERGLSLLFVTHDFGVLAAVCDQVAVLYAGRVAETGPTRAVLDDPQHPYARMLLACHPDRAVDLLGIPGTVPAATAQPPGCRFHPRCPASRADCAGVPPPLLPLAAGRAVACPYHAEAMLG